MLNGLSVALLADGNSATITSVWDLCVKGGLLMIPLGVLSFVSLAITIERMISLSRRRVAPPEFLTGLHAILRNRGEAAAAQEYCRRSHSPLANVILAALRRMHEPIDVIERHVGEAGQREIVRMRKYMRVLSVIASIATLMGLLGTVIGMITAFQTVASSAQALGKTELLAKGIHEALINTAAGLVVAIPSIVVFHWIASRVDRMTMLIDEIVFEFIEEFVRPKNKAPVIVTASAPAAAAGHNGAPAAAGVAALDAVAAG